MVLPLITYCYYHQPVVLEHINKPMIIAKFGNLFTNVAKFDLLRST